MTEHGTPRGYDWHVRHGVPSCDPCRLAHNARIRELTQRITKQGLAADDPRHGTHTAYSNYGCRCDPCRQAGRDHRAGRLREPARLYRPLRHGTQNTYRKYGCRCPACLDWARKHSERRYPPETREADRARWAAERTAQYWALTPEQRKEKNRLDWARRKARMTDEQRAARAAYQRERRRKLKEGD